jgi:hypothetical protein
MSLEPYVPIEVLAKHFTVSVTTVRAWVRQGLVPAHTYIKIGNTYRFSLSKVVAALTAAPAEAEPDTPTPEAAPAEDDDTPVQLELDFSNPDQDA